jgi:hypothetical protein
MLVPWLLVWMLLCEAQAQIGERWRLREDLRIGSETRAELSFTYVSAVVIDRHGNIHIAQPQDHEVRVFDSRGRFLRTVGRRGSGPGEFRSIGALGFRGDTLWVTDPVQYRISLFDPDGRLARSVRLQAPLVPGSSYPGGPEGLLASGAFLSHPRYGEATLRAGVVRPVVLVDGEGAVLDTIGQQRVAPPGGTIRVGQRVFRFGQPQAISDGSLLALAPDGTWLVLVHREQPASPESGRFTVEIVWPGGSRVRREFGYRPVVMPASAVEPVRERLTAGLANTMGLGRAAAARIVRDSLRVPRF